MRERVKVMTKRVDDEKWWKRRREGNKKGQEKDENYGKWGEGGEKS